MSAGRGLTYTPARGAGQIPEGSNASTILYSCPVYHDRVSKALVTESKLRAPTRGASVSSLVWSFDVWPPTGSYFGRARRLAPAPSPLVAGLFSPGPWVCFVFVFPFFFLVRGMARFKVELESVGNHVGSRRVSPFSLYDTSRSW